MLQESAMPMSNRKSLAPSLHTTFSSVRFSITSPASLTTRICVTSTSQYWSDHGPPASALVNSDILMAKTISPRTIIFTSNLINLYVLYVFLANLDHDVGPVALVLGHEYLTLSDLV